jgi:hypothetical protein
VRCAAEAVATTSGLLRQRYSDRALGRAIEDAPECLRGLVTSCGAVLHV